MTRYYVDYIKANRHMRTEYHDLTCRAAGTIFLCSNKIKLEIGDVVEIDEKGNVYKDGVMILDKEKEMAEHMAWVEQWETELKSGGG